MQDAIIFFTDGQATWMPCVDTSPNDGVCDNNCSTYRSRPCYQATQSAPPVAKNAWLTGSTRCSTTRAPSHQVLGLEVDRALGTKLGGGTASCNVGEGIQFLGRLLRVADR